MEITPVLYNKTELRRFGSFSIF